MAEIPIVKPEDFDYGPNGPEITIIDFSTYVHTPGFEGVCDTMSPTGLYCSLYFHHEGEHRAMAPGNRLLESWAQ